MENKHIPENVVVEILMKLPAKSIGRCRCVCKQWRSLLYDQYFIRTHLDRNKMLKQQSLIFFSHSGSAYTLTLTNAVTTQPTTPTKLSFAGYRRSWARVLASCDGLLLLQDTGHRNFLVNSVTRQIKKVQRVSPSSCTVYGLGYDSVSLDYKIVSLSYNYSTHVSFSVYSIKNGMWTKAESLTFDCDVVYITPGVFVDGYIHWIVSKSITESISYSCVITSFHLAQGKFYQIPCPIDTRFFSFHYLVELGGRLCFCTSGHNDMTEVWMMKEYGNSNRGWTKFTIADHRFIKFSLLCMLGQEQVLLAKDENLVVYHLKKGTSTNIAVHGITDGYCIGRTRSCVESLVSPNFSF